jgi:hypothetical protein
MRRLAWVNALWREFSADARDNLGLVKYSILSPIRSMAVRIRNLTFRLFSALPSFIVADENQLKK